MARTKQFDPEQAVEKAMELFWCRGYEATSLDDLCRHLGIGKGSFYATFGSKQALYNRALEKYRSISGGQVMELLSAPGPLRPRLRTLMRGFIADTMRDKRGCMMGNAAAERGGVDAATAGCVRASFGDVERAMAGAIARAQAQGELPTGRDPATLATMLMTFAEGLQLVAKVDPRADALAQATEHVLASLG
jgi:TetR/AcrR family transcriptional repressor of nem operon